MDIDLPEIRERVNKAFAIKAKIVWRSTRFVKIGLILMGTFLVGVGAVLPPPPQSLQTNMPQHLGPSQFLMFFGSLMAFVGGLYVVLTDEDTSDVLDEARRAIDWAEGLELERHEILELSYEYEDALEQMTSLYTVMTVARGHLERAVLKSHINPIAVIQTMIEVVKWNLRIALEFNLNEIWTICVYKVETDPETHERVLRLVAHDRSKECKLDSARLWPSGVGVGGVAFAKNDEVVIPDLDDPAAGTAFSLEKAMKKEEDSERYKSMIAVPVQLGPNDVPWGVVIGTSNVAYHFGNKENLGVDPEEGIRTLAGLVALAIAVCQNNNDGKVESAQGRKENDEDHGEEEQSESDKS